MKRFITIYKFNTPFVDTYYEKGVGKAINTCIKRVLLYNEIKFDIETFNDDFYYSIKYLFGTNSYIVISWMDKNINQFYIPALKVEIVLNMISDNQKSYIILLKEILSQFNGLDKTHYIVDIDYDLQKMLKKDDLKDFTYLSELENNYHKFNGESKINLFLIQMNNNYNIDPDLLDGFSEINYYIMYLVYTYYTLLYFILMSQETKTAFENDINNNCCDDILKANLQLFDVRLDHVQNISYVNFKKYSKMINSFFSLFNVNK